MPRNARKISNSQYYHIMIRGNEKKNIFIDNEDKERLLKTLIKMKSKEEYDIIAYCIMDNHAHLLLREDKDSLKRSMKRIEVSYAVYFNKKYRRIGHLFQDRYKSEPIEADSHMLECVRYIHNNPVKAKIVLKAEKYRWSSYNKYLIEEKSDEIIGNKGLILDIFSNNISKAIKEFKKFSKKETDTSFIDVKDEMSEIARDDGLTGYEKIEIILENEKMHIEGLKNLDDKKKRNEILRKIKQESGLSIRELAEIFELSKDIIFRA